MVEREAAQPKISLRSLLGLFWLVLVAFWHGQHRFASFAMMGATLASLVVVFIASLTAHEIGHAVAARFVNFRPYGLVVGGGPALLHREVFGVAVRIGSLPGSGLTLFATQPDQKQIKWRLFLTLAAGPLVSSALLLIGLYVIPGDWRALRAGTDAWLGPGAALVVVNGFVLITTAIPPISTPPNTVGPDLIRILTLPWMSQDQLQSMTRPSELEQVSRLFMLRQYRAAFALGQRRLQTDPGDWGVRYLLTIVFQWADRNTDAAEQYRVLLNTESLPPGKRGDGLRSVFSNNLAWSLYRLDDPSRLEEAEQAAKNALALNSHEPAYLGTYGTILIEKGQLLEGSNLVRRALAKQFAASSIASNYSALAIASAREADIPRAQRLLHKARRRDRTNPLLPRAERELSAAQARLSSSSTSTNAS